MTSKILRKFQALDLDGISQAEFQIKFIEPEFFNQTLDFMVKFFLAHEPMCHSRKISEDPIAVEENLKNYRKILKDEKISIGCFKVEGESETLVSVNILSVKRKENYGKGEIDVASKNVRDIFQAFAFVESQFDVFEHYKVDAYLSAFGVAVNPIYRGRGIAVEIMKARNEVLKFLGLKVTSTLFSAIASQKAAMKAGFKENFEMTYENLSRHNENFLFQGLEGSIKIMSLIVE